MSAPIDSNPDLVAAKGETSRLRFALEGFRPVTFAGGATLTPTLEVALRRDGGDAETGNGVEVGGGLTWSDPSSRLSAELRARSLLAHSGGGYLERGVSIALALAPDRRGRGLSLSLAAPPVRQWAVPAFRRGAPARGRRR